MPDLATVLRQASTRDVITSIIVEKQTHLWLKEDAFRDRILSRLGELPGVTMDDILAAWDSVEISERSDPSLALERFASALVAESNRHWLSDAIAVGPPGCFIIDVSERPTPLWLSEDGRYSAFAVATLPIGEELRQPYKERDSSILPFGGFKRLHIQIAGSCSRRFFESLVALLSNAVSTLLRCLRELATDAFMENMQPFFDRPEETVHDAALERVISDERDFEDLTKGARSSAIPADDTNSAREMSYDSLTFVRDSLNALFKENTSRKDSIAKRVKNAVRLMVEADNQANNSIGLALAVSVVESLLCRKSDNLSQMFGESMAALLEPDPKFRFEAERWGKRLYELRSGVFHGSDLDCPASMIRQARLAAGQVLRAMLERRAAIKRLGGSDENTDDFLSELLSGKYNPGQLTHVSDMPIKRFWRSGAPKRVE